LQRKKSSFFLKRTITIAEILFLLDTPQKTSNTSCLCTFLWLRAVILFRDVEHCGINFVNGTSSIGFPEIRPDKFSLIPGIESMRNQTESELIPGAEPVLQGSTSRNRMHSLKNLIANYHGYTQILEWDFLKACTSDLIWWKFKLIIYWLNKNTAVSNPKSAKKDGKLHIVFSGFWKIKIWKPELHQKRFWKSVFERTYFGLSNGEKFDLEHFFLNYYRTKKNWMKVI